MALWVGSYRTRRGLMLAAVAGLALVGTGCGEERVAARAGVPPADDFVDVFSADLAGTRHVLSLAVVGRRRGRPTRDQVVRVYTRGRESGWRRAPGLARPLEPGNPVSLTARGPCVGFESRPRGRVVACLRAERWRLVEGAGLPPRPARLLRLLSCGGTLCAVFQSRALVEVVRLANGRWRRLGKTLRTNGRVAAVGESGSAAIDVALADVASGERVVWTLARGRWRPHTALRGAGGGPMPGGPVRLGSRMYLPVIDAFAEPWKLSVHVLTGGVWGVADGLLNRGVGNAQGVLTAGGGAVWASWQENEQRADRLFNTRMYAQRVAPRVGEATEVWAGTSIGPGSIETAEAIGRRWILYMPAANGRSALSVAVEPLR